VNLLEARATSIEILQKAEEERIKAADREVIEGVIGCTNSKTLDEMENPNEKDYLLSPDGGRSQP
jgi:hypothetical protein